jgi:hypothetical protein
MYLADVPIGRKLLRIDSQESVPERKDFLKPKNASTLAIRALFAVSYGYQMRFGGKLKKAPAEAPFLRIFSVKFSRALARFPQMRMGMMM